MDTRLLDVAIGLVLVFAVSSLLVTALQELIASMRKSRSKVLEASVMSILQGDKVLADKVFSHPMVRALYRGSRLPSYLPTNVFVTALLNRLGGESATPREGTPAEFVARIMAENAGLAEDQKPKMLEMLPVLLQGAEQDWAVFETQIGRWFDDVGERATGWFKRDTQIRLFFLGIGVAFVFNIDALAITSSLWKEKALRESMVTVAQSLAEFQGGDPVANGKTSGAAPTESGENKPAVKPPLQGNESTRKVEHALGDIRSYLDDPAAQEDAYYEALEELGKLEKALDVERGYLGRQTIDSQRQEARVNQHIDRVLAVFGDTGNTGKAEGSGTSARIDELVASLKIALVEERGSRTPYSEAGGGHQCEEEDPELQAACRKLAALNSVAGLDFPIGWSCRHPLASRAEWFCEPPARAVEGGASFWGILLGCLAGWFIIGIAATLGAPFWFDLLNRLMKLRASGARLTGGVEPATPGATPAPGPTASDRPASSDAMSDGEKKLSEAEILSIQRRLGMSNEEQSGRLDGVTRGYIKQWQKVAGRLETGILTDQEAGTLLGSDAGEETFEG